MKKENIFVLGIVSVIFFLSGCGQENNEKIENQPNPTHIYEEVREDILIDADVICPEGDFVPKICVAEAPEITKKQVDEFLTACNDSVALVEVDEIIDKAEFYYTKTAKGYSQELSISRDVDYCGSNFAYFVPEEIEYYHSVLQSYHRDKLSQVSSVIPYNADLYREPKEFSFATEAEAEAKVRELLEILGLKEIVLEETLYLDHAIMEKYEQELMQQYEDKTYVPKDSWTEADDSYHFLFCPAVDGISTISSTLENQTLQLFPCEILVKYSAKGVTLLLVSYPMQNKEVIETLDYIISASEAMAVVREKLDGTYFQTDVVVEEIALRYCPVQDKERWLLKPVWEVLVREKDVKHEFSGTIRDECFYVWVDGITGKEM